MAEDRIAEHRQSLLSIEVVDSNGVRLPNANVRVDMQRHAFGFGTAVKASRIVGNSRTNQTYREKILENFNHVVFENDLKWPAWDGLWGSGFNWSQTRRAADWLEENRLPARGHYLSWGTWSGDDAHGGIPGESTLRQRLFDHIEEKATTVGERVFEWDVINHPVGWLGSNYETTYGPDFYSEIVEHAREVTPEGMPLWINEDNILAGGALASQYERVVETLIENDAAPDGIGFQSHFVEEWNRIRTPQFVYRQLDRFAELIPNLRITEMDIDVGDDDVRQAELLRDYLTVMFSHKDVQGVTFWGFWEGAHWRRDAAWYNTDWSEKEAIKVYQDLVLDEWWTNETGATDETGTMEVDGFYGEYEITVETNGETYQRTVELGPDGANVSFVIEAGCDLGDINCDGTIDSVDIDLISLDLRNMTEFDTTRDLDSNEMLDLADRDFLIQSILGTRHGDADLNGTVDFSDFLTMSGNFGAAGGWAFGDFDGDGEVAFSDFLEVSRNFGKVGTLVANAPEPSSAWLAMSFIFSFALRGRRSFELRSGHACTPRHPLSVRNRDRPCS